MKEKDKRASGTEELLRCYYIYGTDGELLRQAVARLKKRFSQESPLEFSCSEFWGEESDADNVISACRTVSLLAPRRLVVVRNVEALTAGDKESLADFLLSEEAGGNCVLVLAEARKDSRGKSVVDKSGKLFTAVKKAGQVSEYSRSANKEATIELVRRLFAGHDKVITEEAARRLAAAFGHDLSALTLEVDKVCLYCWEQKKVGLEEVLAVVSPSGELGVFDLIDAIARRQGYEATAIARSLAQLPGESSRLFPLLESQLRLLLQAKALGKATPSRLAKELGISSGRAYYVERQSRALSTDFLSKALILLAETDFSRKTGATDLGSAMEGLVARLSAL